MDSSRLFWVSGPQSTKFEVKYSFDKEKKKRIEMDSLKP